MCEIIIHGAGTGTFVPVSKKSTPEESKDQYFSDDEEE